MQPERRVRGRQRGAAFYAWAAGGARAPPGLLTDLGDDGTYTLLDTRGVRVRVRCRSCATSRRRSGITYVGTARSTRPLSRAWGARAGSASKPWVCVYSRKSPLMRASSGSASVTIAFVLSGSSTRNTPTKELPVLLACFDRAWDGLVQA